MEIGYQRLNGRWITIKVPHDEKIVTILKSSFYPIVYLKKEKVCKVAFNSRNIKKIIAEFPTTIIHKDILTQIELDRNKEALQGKFSGLNNQIEGFGTIWPFQAIALRFLEACEGRGLLGMEMGLGKTVVSLAYMFKHKPRATLIICPASVKFNWKLEINKWLKTDPVVFDTSSKHSLQDVMIALNDGGIAIANYEAAKKIDPVFIDMLILDECHMIKDPAAGRSKEIARLAKISKKLIGLSGTPMPSRPKELFHILKLIDSANWFSFVKYAEMYCDGHYEFFGPRKIFMCNGSSHLDILRDKLRYFMWSAKKEDVLKDLPPIRRAILPVELDNDAEYKALESDLLEELYSKKAAIEGMIDNLKNDDSMSILVKINALQQLTAVLKVPGISRWVNEFLERTDEQIIIYAQHLEALNKLKDILGKAKAEVITGETPIPDREDIVARFTKKKFRVLLMSKVGTLGINLSTASNFLLVEQDWVPAMDEQAIARIHRPGQKAEAVLVYYAYSPSTIDEQFAKVLENKKKIGKVLTSTQIIAQVALEMVGKYHGKN